MTSNTYSGSGGGSRRDTLSHDKDLPAGAGQTVPLNAKENFQGRPHRIQRQRTKGWRMPENTVYVGRPTIWGNRHRAEILGGSLAVALFRSDIDEGKAGWPGKGLPLSRSMIQTKLRGRNLACWCAIGQPCHADVLLELANA